ncbi:MAG: hypothetical protein AAGM33_12230, partial [Pseudomonadota bacterium]
MTISLPANAIPNGASPLLRDFSGIATPFLGGPEIRYEGIGTRFGLNVSMPMQESADDGRILVSRLLQARSSRLLMPWPLLDFDPGSPGSPVVDGAVTGGSALPVAGLSAGYQAKEGQFFSIIHNSRRYVHMITGDGTANASGDLALGIFPMLRTDLTAGDVIELAQPMIEGHVLPGDELRWQMSIDRHIGVSFSVMEAA